MRGPRRRNPSEVGAHEDRMVSSRIGQTGGQELRHAAATGGGRGCCAAGCEPGAQKVHTVHVHDDFLWLRLLLGFQEAHFFGWALSRVATDFPANPGMIPLALSSLLPRPRSVCGVVRVGQVFLYYVFLYWAILYRPHCWEGVLNSYIINGRRTVD